MGFENRRWLVIPTSIIDTINFNEVLESSVDSLRKSIDDSQTFVKYNVKVVDETVVLRFPTETIGEYKTTTIEPGVYGRPNVYSTDYTEYNHTDILALLSTDAWTSSEIE